MKENETYWIAKNVDGSIQAIPCVFIGYSMLNKEQKDENFSWVSMILPQDIFLYSHSTDGLMREAVLRDALAKVKSTDLFRSKEDCERNIDLEERLQKLEGENGDR